jgi:putative toxin-antitoxin system antitoxin component (TIGR02293 family)
MAHAAASARAFEAAARAEGFTRDVGRFREFLARGGPGAHAYVVLLGLDTFDAPHLMRAVKNGFPYRTLERFQRNTGLPLDLLIELVDIPRRTLARRKRDGRLGRDESDRLLRASRVFARALALFEGDRDAATEWLTARQPALGGAVPIALAKTDLGAREVEALAGRLEHGVFP